MTPQPARVSSWGSGAVPDSSAANNGNAPGGGKPPVLWNKPKGSIPPGPTATRVWLHLDNNGKASYVQVPMPYPTAIFIREKALVINLETIKMIICRDQ
eukprot:scaffold59063_cov45-Prasinocladus_malaysianus.AAC.1